MSIKKKKKKKPDPNSSSSSSSSSSKESSIQAKTVLTQPPSSSFSCTGEMDTSMRLRRHEERKRKREERPITDGCMLAKIRRVNGTYLDDPVNEEYGVLKMYAAALKEVLPILQHPTVDQGRKGRVCDCRDVLLHTRHDWIVKNEIDIWNNARQRQPIFRVPIKERSHCWVMNKYIEYASQDEEEDFDLHFDIRDYYKNVARGVRNGTPLRVVGDMYYCLLFLKKRIASERPEFHRSENGAKRTSCKCYRYARFESTPKNCWRPLLIELESKLDTALRRSLNTMKREPNEEEEEAAVTIVRMMKNYRHTDEQCWVGIHLKKYYRLMILASYAA
jgi:hypothetical protein